MRKLTLLFALLCASVMGWAVTYCDFATGHENNANFGDPNGRILLTLEPGADANEYTLTVKPNYANGATKQLDYLYVIAGGNSPYPAEAGADEGGTGYDELSVSFTNSSATATFTIQWSNPDWGGRWQCTLTDVPLSELTSCSGGGDPTPGPNPDPDPEPQANPYCDFATGHENNANFGDPNGRILLTLVPGADANEYTLTVKPNYANGALKQLDYIYVIAGGNSPYPAEAGADEGGTGYDELSVSFTNSSATASFTIQWSNPDWGGRWQCTLADVPLSTLAACSGGSTPEPEPTEIYDVNFALQSEGGVASAKSGNDAGLANNGNTGDRWWSETADMTDEQKNDQWWQVNLGQRRIFNTIQIVWEGAWGKSFDIQISDDGSAWTTVKEIRNQNLAGETFPYLQTIELAANQTAQYVRFQGIERGTQWAYSFWEFRVLLPNASVLTSIDLTAPATIAQVGGSGMALTVTPKDQNGQTMEAAISYEITPAAAGHMSGNTFIPDQAGAASIRAYNGSVYSSAVQIYGVPSANLALSTNISTDNKIIDQSEFAPNGTDAFHAVDGSMGSTWQGSPTNGNVDDSREYDCWFVVDLGAYYNISLVALHFEGACSELYHIDFSANNSDWNLGYNLVGAEGINARNDYWTDLNNNQKVRYVRFWSSKSATVWGMKMFEFEVYGTVWESSDVVKPVMGTAALVSSTYDQAVIAVTATDNDEVARYHVVDASHGIDANFTPAAGNITITGLTHGTDYNFTITAKDATGNESDNSVVLPVSTPFNSTINLALNQPSEAGYEDGNPAEVAGKANDGNDGSAWVTYADRPASEEWWIVDLGQVYTLTNIQALWAGDYSTNYILQARVETPSAADKADDAAWVTLATVTDAAANAENSTAVSGVGRYVRFRSITRSSNCIRLRELRVFGSGIASVDTEAPVMTSASLVSNTDSHAVIAVAATDDQGIANYHVVDAGHSIDAHLAAEGGNITVSGLTGNTTYAFTITAVDFFGNESANSKSVSVTTTAHLIAPAAACPAPTWPAAQVKALYSPTYEADYNHQDWGSGTVATVDEFGRKYVTNGNGYFGADGFALNCIEMEKLHYDIWIADDATIHIVPIWGGAEQGITVSLTGQQWNSIDIDLTDYNQVANWGNIYQMKIDYAVNLTFWVANAYFYRTTPIVDSEAPTNVSASMVAEGFHSVKISARATDDHGAVNFKVMNGASQVATGAAASGEAVTISVNDLALGTNYNFSVVAFDEAGNEAAPVAVAASTKALPASAPVDLEGKEIVPLFTDATTCDVTGIQSGGWGESTIAQWIDIAQDDKVFYGQNFNYAGWHSWGSDLDVTGKKFLHMDIYSTGMTQVSATPISHDPTSEGNYAIALTPDAWTSVDIPLSAYDANNIEWNKIFQFKFMGAVGGDELLIDNVYFWNWPAISLNDQEDNSAVIEANNNKHADVTVSRTFPETGEWYTLCLPFDANASQLAAALGSGYKLAELESSEDRGALIHLNFDFVNALQAGKAYMFKPGVAVTEAPQFEGVLVKDVNPAALKSECEHMTFQGTFGQITLNQENQLFVGPENYLYSPAEGGTEMDAFRCFFTVANGGSLAPGKRAKVVFGPQVVTDITNVTEQSVPTKFMHNGVLYIVRDGRTYTAQGLLVK